MGPSWTNLRYYLRFGRKGLRKIKKYLAQDSKPLELRNLLTGEKSVIRLIAKFGMCLSVGVTIFGKHLRFEVITANIHLIKFYQQIKVYIGFVPAIRIITKTKMNYRSTLLKRYIHSVFCCNNIIHDMVVTTG